MTSLAFASSDAVALKYLLLVIWTIASGVLAGPTPTGLRNTPRTCVSFCKESSKFFYEPGNTYVYDLTTDIQTVLLEGSHHGSQVQLSSKIQIEPITSCELKLTIKDVTITEHNAEQSQNQDVLYLKQTLEKHSLLFAFQDGKVEHLCSNPEEAMWVTNIKRGILSMLQNIVDVNEDSAIVQETDVNGKCKTYYKSSINSMGGGVTVTKTKDLSSCSHRHTHLIPIQSIPYNPTDSERGMTLVTGNITCRQVIRNNKFEMVECSEEQKFKPFESSKSGAKSIIKQILEYQSSFPSTPADNDQGQRYKKQSLLYETDKESAMTHSDTSAAMILIAKIELATAPQVKAEAPTLFFELVEELRRLNQQGLQILLESVTSVLQKKILMDALPLVNSEFSIPFLRILHQQGELSEGHFQAWLSSVAFIKDPSAPMIKALLPLLEEEDATPNALLSVSAVINSYCRSSSDCTKDNLVTQALQAITTALGSGCEDHETPLQSRKIILALKVIGNIGVQLSTSQSSTIEQCFTHPSNPAEIRLAAIDSYRRLPCSAFSLDPFITAFSNTNQNTEVRIASYLMTMRCANSKTIETVRSILQEEEVNQVGSFVWTHLTNLQETNRIDKQQLKNLVSNEVLKNKFRTDIRKYSRNFESSFFSKDWNAGAGLDSNIIFTEESFLPKSGMLNITIQLFGESVNLVEFGGRFQSPEILLEPIFGPNGYFPDESMKDFLQSSRIKRSTNDNEIERLNSLYDASGHGIEKTPTGTFYARVFGHEVMYKDFKVTTDSTVPNFIDEKGTNWLNIKTLLENMSTGKKTDFTRSAVLMDISYSAPTSAGIPFTLGLRASSTVSLAAEGKFNVGRFLESKELEVYGFLKPNTAVNIDASLVTRIGTRNKFLKTGLTVRNILRSSTVVETKLHMNGRKSVKLDFNLPQEKQEIFEASSEVVVLKGNGVVESLDTSGADQISQPYCFGESYSDIWGIKICGLFSRLDQLSLTPVTPIVAKLYVQKTDKFNGYHIDYNFNDNPNETKLSLVFDTPGSEVNRKSSIELSRSPSLGRYYGSIQTPLKLIKAEGTYLKLRKKFELTVLDDDNKIFHFNSSLHQTGNKIEPQLSLTVMKRPLADVKGVIEIPNADETRKRATVDLTMKHLTQTPIRVHGTLVMDNGVNLANLGIESYYLSGNLKSQIKLKPGHISTKSVMEYSWKQAETNKVDINAKLQKLQKGILSKFSAAASFSMSKFPDQNVEFLWETQTSKGFCENTAKFAVGKSTWDAHTLFSRQTSNDFNEIRLQASLTNLRNDVDYLIEFGHKMIDQSISTKLIGKTSSTSMARLHFDYDAESRPFLKRNVTAAAIWPGSEYSFQASLKEKQKGEFEGELLIDLNKLKEMKATVTYINKSNNLRLDHSLDFRARGFSSVPVSGSLAFSATDKQSHIGCQIQLEGRKPHNSRLSTSIDYSHSRNTHKVEAKVTFNEKKYNGEITYHSSKADTKHLVIDLHMDNHIHVDAKIAGMYPNPMMASFSLVPDKQNNPQDKLELRGSLDLQDVTFTVNYFGDKLEIKGGYNDSRIGGEAIWSENQKLSLTLEFPVLQLKEASITAHMALPIYGYRNISGQWEHQISDAASTFSLQGNLEHTELNSHLKWSMNSTDLEADFLGQLSSHGTYKANFIAINDDGRKQLKIELDKDYRKVTINTEYKDTLDSSAMIVDFKGCSYFPEVLFELYREHHADGHRSRMLQMGWGKRPFTNALRFDLRQWFSPLTYQFSFITPWDIWRTMSGHVIFDKLTSSYSIHMDNTVGLDLIKYIPTRLDAVTSGSKSNFRHLINGNFNNAQGFQAYINGGLNGLVNSSIQSSVAFKDINVGCELLSVLKEQNNYRGEFKGNFNGGNLRTGLEWTEVEGIQNLSVWANLPNGENHSAVGVYKQDLANGDQVSLEVKESEKTLIKTSGAFQFDNFTSWKLSTSLESHITHVPSFILKSTSTQVNEADVDHKTEWTYSATEESFLSRFPVKTLLVTASLENLASLSGTVTVNNKTLTILGNVRDLEYGYEANVELLSSEFRTVKVNGRYQLSDSMADLALELNQNQEDYINFEFTLDKNPNSFTSGLFLSSVLTPTLDGQVTVNFESGNTNLFFKYNELYVIQIVGVVQANTSLGNITLKVNSGIFPAIDDLNLSSKYSLQIRNAELDLTYASKSSNYQLNADGNWSDDEKGLRMSAQGDFVGSFEIQMVHWNKIIAFVTRNEKKLWEINLDYEAHMGEYSWGQHQVIVRHIDSNQEVTTIKVVCGLDPKSFDFKVETPFVSWTQVRLHGKLDIRGSTTKTARFGFQRENSKVESGFDYKTFKRNGTSIVSTDVLVLGFANLREELFKSMNISNYGMEIFSADSLRFGSVVRWSANVLDFTIETPIEEWENFSLESSWEFSKPQKQISVRGNRMGSVFDIKGSCIFRKNKGEFQLVINTLAFYRAELKYDFGKSKQISWALDGFAWKGEGKVVYNDGFILIEADTPFRQLENVMGKFSNTTNSSSGQSFVVEWAINKSIRKIELDYINGKGETSINLKTPFVPWDHVRFNLKHDERLKNIQMKAIRGDSKQIVFLTTTKESSEGSQNSYAMDVSLETPFDGYLSSNFGFIHETTDEGHSLKIKGNKMDTLGGELDIAYRNQSPWSTHVSTKLFSNQGIDSTTKLALQLEDNGKITGSIKIDSNKMKHEVNLSVERLSDKKLLELTTTFPFLKQVTVSYESKEDKQFHVLWEGNGDTIGVHGSADVKSTNNANLTMTIVSTLPGLRSVSVNLHHLSNQGIVTSGLNFQNKNHRWLAKLNGNFIDLLNGEWVIQLNTPLEEYQDINLSFGIKKSTDLKQLKVSVARNSIRIAEVNASVLPDRTQFSLSSNLLDIQVALEGTVEYSSEKSLQMTVNAGDNELKTSLEVNIQGFDSGLVNFKTNLIPNASTKFAWKILGDLKEGSAWTSITNTAIGSKSIRGQWKTISWKEMRADVWVKLNELEPETTGSILASVNTDSNGVWNTLFNLKYAEESENNHVSLYVQVKQAGKSFNADVKFKTPLTQLDTFNLSGQLKLNTPIVVTLKTNLNLFHVDASAQFDVVKSLFNLQYQNDQYGDPSSVAANYDFHDENKNAEFHFKQGQYEVKLKNHLTIPRDSKEIELDMSLTSSVPILGVSVDGNFKGSYAYNSNGISSITLSLQSNSAGNWKLEGALRPTISDFHAMVHLEEDKGYIPTVTFEANYRGTSRQGISSDVSLVYNQSKLAFNALLRPDRLSITAESPFENFRKIVLDGRMNMETAKKEAEVTLTIDNQIFNLMSYCDFVSGQLHGTSEITISKGPNKDRIGRIFLKLQKSGQLEFLGVWQQHEIRIEGTATGQNNQLWSQSGLTELSIIFDGSETAKVQSTHKISVDEYSLNVTAGPSKVLKVHFTKGSLISSVLEWDSHWKFRLNAELKPNFFEIFVSNPWTPDITLSGMLQDTPTGRLFDGYLLYDSQKSSIRLKTESRKETSNFEVTVDIPVLHQKLDTTISILNSDRYRSQGSLDMMLNGRHLGFQCQLFTKMAGTGTSKQKESKLSLNLIFPSQEVPQITSELIIRRPINHYGNIHIYGHIQMREETTSLSLQYNLPIHGSDLLLLEATCNSQIFLGKKYSLSMSSKGPSWKNFDGKVTFGLNEFDTNWNFELPNVSGSLRAFIGSSSYGSKEYAVSSRNFIDLKNMVNITVSAICKDKTLSFESTTWKEGRKISSELSIDAPQLLGPSHHYKVQIEEVSPRTLYSIAARGHQGKSHVNFEGELSFGRNKTIGHGKLSGTYGLHFIGWTFERQFRFLALNLQLESTTYLIGKRVSSSSELKWDETSFSGKVQCNTAKSVHTFTTRGNWSEKGKSLEIKLDTPVIEPVKIAGEWKSGVNTYFATVTGNFNNMNNSIEGLIDLQDIEGRLTVNSPILPSSVFNAHLKFKNVLELKNFEILTNIEVQQIHWLVEGSMLCDTLKDCSLKTHVITPFKSFSEIMFAGKFTKDEIYAEILTPFDVIPNGLLHIQGIEGVRLKTWTNMKPSVKLQLPFGKYSVVGVVKVPNTTENGELHILAEHGNTGSMKTYELLGQVSSFNTFSWNMVDPGLVRLRIASPRKVLELFEVATTYKLSGKSLIELKSEASLKSYFAEFSDRGMKFAYRNDNDRPEITLEFSTPFESYERIALQIAINKFKGIGTGQSVHMILDKSDWEDKLELNADYRYIYKGFLDMEAEVNGILISFMDAPPVHLKFVSRNEQSNFTGNLEGFVGTNNVSLLVEAVLHETGISASLDAKAGDEDPYESNIQFHFYRTENTFRVFKQVKFQSRSVLFISAQFSPELQVAGGELKVVTPWGPIEGNLALLPVSVFLGDSDLTFDQILENINVTFNLNFNSRRIIGLECGLRDDNFVFDIFNPFSPISVLFNVKYAELSETAIVGEISWDIHNRVGNTVGFKFRKNTGNDHHKIGIEIHAAEAGKVDITLTHTMNPSLLNNSIDLKWDSPFFESEGRVGYSIIMSSSTSHNQKSLDCFAQVDLPWRSVQIDTFHNKSMKESQSSFTVKWDATNDPSKFISIKTHEEMKMTWRVIEASRYLEIKHPMSDTPLMLSFDQIYKDNRFQHIEVDLKTSSNPNGNFMFLISRNKTDWSNFKILVHHAPSNLHTELSASISSPNVAADLTYMNVHKSMQAVYLRSFCTAADCQIKLHSGGDSELVKYLDLETHFYQDPMILRVQVTSSNLDMKLQKSLPYFESTFNQRSGENIVKFVGGFLHKKEVGLKLIRSGIESTINYLVATIKLNTSNTLSARVNWDEDTWSALSELELSQVVNAFVPEIPMDKIASMIAEEVELRWKSVSPEIQQVLQVVAKTIAQEIESIFGEWRAAMNYLNDLYQSNAMWVKDICEYLNVPLQEGLSLGRVATSELVNLSKVVLRRGADLVKWIQTTSEFYEGKLEKAIIDTWDRLEDYVNKIWRGNLAWLSTTFDCVEELVEAFMETFEGKIEEIEKKLLAVGLIKRLIQLYRDYSTWIEEIPIQDYVENVENMFTVRIWDKLVKYVQPLIDAIKNGVEDEYFLDLLETPPLPYIRQFMSNLETLFDNIWESIEIEQRIKNLLRASLKSVDGLVHRYIPAGTFTYDEDRGTLEYDQSLGVITWKDFTQLPSWKASEQDTQDVNQLTNFYYQVLDQIESLKPLMNLNIRSVLPPFGSYALMAGDYHYFTFDKKYFRFAGECSYLLVGDSYADQDPFSLIVNYVNQDGTAKKKSYSVVTGENVVNIELDSFKITVNNRKVELPLEIGSILIRRHQSGLEIYDKRGFHMSCSLSPNVCTFWTSGWHFGKLTGLLGTYDNEPTNDLRNPEGQIIQDVSVFAHSWRVGKNSGTCRLKNFAKDDVEPTDIDGICHNLLLNRSSPLRPCFNTVDTQVYMDMCKYDLSKNINNANRNQAACSSMSAYVAECQKNNVDIWMPPACVRCRLEDGTALTTGENATLETNGELEPPMSSDNVILLEATSCINSTHVSEAVKHMELALNAQGLFNNRYSIVSYGGIGLEEKPHVKTISSRVWSHSTLFKAPNDAYTNEETTTDLYEAIEYASTMGFRAGVSKNLIAFTCGTDRCGNPAKYADLLTLLVENDMKLHLLAPKAFTLKGNKKMDGTEKILGMDSTGVYTTKHMKQELLEPDAALKRQVNIPKDFCTPLAIESNGSRFDSEMPSKKLLNVWSRRVALTSFPSKCQRCECVPDKYGSASLMCHHCVSPSLMKFMQEWEKYNGADDDDLTAFDMLDHQEFDALMIA